MDEKVGLGILFGMGMMLLMLGFFGWLHANYLVERLRYIFENVGDKH